ncbi:hypothetical protein BHM03_00058691 [Ensete ventricosum]|nr:hypothetical protein BHM03_00058691 [Ensete ventricosum]
MLEDIMECLLCNLHEVQKSLHFWHSQAEGTNAQKIYFIIFERGPRAFIDGTYEMLCRLGTNGSPFQHLSHAASNTICHNIAILTSLRHCLANSLAQVFCIIYLFIYGLNSGRVALRNFVLTTFDYIPSLMVWNLFNLCYCRYC